MDLQVAAYFEPVSDLELNILIEPADSGWSVGSGIYDLNDAIPILAITKDGWLFKQWIEMILIKQIQPALQSIYLKIAR